MARLHPSMRSCQRTRRSPISLRARASPRRAQRRRARMRAGAPSRRRVRSSSFSRRSCSTIGSAGATSQALPRGARCSTSSAPSRASARADVARRLSLDPSTALYHLRRLERHRFVIAEGERRARWFVPGAHAAEDRARLAAQARSGAGAVLHAIRAQPGVHKARLAQSLAISRATADWHLATLARAGLVRLERTRDRVLVYPITF